MINTADICNNAYLISYTQAQQQASFVEQQSPPGTNAKEFRIPADQGIAGHVAQTGQLLNIRDAYSHPLFYPDVDKSTGFQTRHVPIFDVLPDMRSRR
jgi:signal transduction protein with GAF and PtsI domain